MAKKKENKIDLGEALRERYERWNTLNTEGGTDPFYSDGGNMNLVRNHIIYYKKMIEENMKESDYPKEYYDETPPVMDLNYIARKSEIVLRAPDVLKIYEADENYLWLKDITDKLTKEQKKESNIENVLGYREGLKRAIETGDVLGMRRHVNGLYSNNAQYYLDSFKDCRKRIETMLGIESEGEEDMARIAELEAQVKELTEKNEKLLKELETLKKAMVEVKPEPKVETPAEVKIVEKPKAKAPVKVEEKPKTKKTVVKEAKTTKPTLFSKEIDVISKLKDVRYEIDRTWLWVFGDTRQYKDDFKKMGMRWSGKRCGWYLMSC